MKLLLSLIFLGAGYYSFSYGIYLWKNENNKLAAFGVILITLMGTIIPIYSVYSRM
jgi:hypothetical protein